jgi:ectoine hydroxylase-related dioxygenase (phytanoyl-CoA dioxygenase family)
MFQRHGWELIRQVATADELNAASPALHAAALARCRTGSGAAFMPVSDLWRVDEACRAFTFNPRYAVIAARLLACTRVRLYHDQAMFTEPGGASTPWHQDAQHWAVPGDRCLTMWMPLVDLTTDMGTLTYASASQRDGMRGDWPISPASQAYFSELVRGNGWPVVNAGAMAAGDALFHDGFVLHGAPANTTARLRAVMTVLYVADDTPLIEPRWPAQAAALAQWSPGQRAGESYVGPLIR